jgi:hypothetical protein
VNGSVLLPDILPGTSAPGVDKPYDFTVLSPRLGITYALDENRKTLARASYSSFASQLSAAQAGFVSAIQYSYIYYYAVDRNGNQTAERSEILFNLGNAGYVGFDPANPTAVSSVNQVDPDIGSPRAHELMFGMDRELMPNFSLSGTFTWRRYNDVFWRPLIGVTSADYHQTGTLTGNAEPIGSFSVPFYALNDEAVPPGGGREETNRAGYHQQFMGFEISATKRMSNRWMARLGFSTNNHVESFDDPSVAIEDPTPRVTTAAVWAHQDGGQVVRVTTGSGKSGIYMILPKYQFIANGLWQGREPGDAAGLRPVVQSEQRPDRRPAWRAKEDSPHPRGCRRFPAADGHVVRLPHRESVHAAAREPDLRPGHLQPGQRGHCAGEGIRQAADLLQHGPRDHESAHPAAGFESQLLNRRTQIALD